MRQITARGSIRGDELSSFCYFHSIAVAHDWRKAFFQYMFHRNREKRAVCFPLVAIFCDLPHGNAFDGGVDICILRKFNCYVAIVGINAAERHLLAQLQSDMQLLPIVLLDGHMLEQRRSKTYESRFASQSRRPSSTSLQIPCPPRTVHVHGEKLITWAPASILERLGVQLEDESLISRVGQCALKVVPDFSLRQAPWQVARWRDIGKQIRITSHGRQNWREADTIRREFRTVQKAGRLSD